MEPREQTSGGKEDAGISEQWKQSHVAGILVRLKDGRERLEEVTSSGLSSVGPGEGRAFSSRIRYDHILWEQTAWGFA